MGEQALPVRPATLDGFALAADPNSLRVAIAARTGGHVAGVLVVPPPEARGRLDFAFAAMGARPVPVRVRADGAEVDAAAYAFEFLGPRRRLARRTLPGGTPRSLRRGAG